MKRSRLSFAPWLYPVLALLVNGCSSEGGGVEPTGADPGILEAPIAFVKRPIPLDDNDNEIQADLRDPLFFAEGGDVYIRSNSTVTATETNISFGVTGGQGDVKDLRPSFDGNKLLFTLRLFDENPNDDDTPSWNIYEYDLTTQTLRRIIPDTNDLLAEEGDDVAPAYLPDGRIIFSSNRQSQSGQILTDEGKPRFRALEESEQTMAMVLHVMNDDGSELHQISFNQSHDLDPMVLTNQYSGEVMFTRWDNAGGNNAMHLYKTTPDGTDAQVLYGAHSHATGTNNASIQFSRPEEMEDGRIMFIARPYTGTFDGGDVVIVDAQNFADNSKTVASMAGMPGTAESRATINNISSANELSLGGRYSAAYPLWDGSNRMLASKSTCQLRINDVLRPCIEPHLSDPDAEEASPAYAIWLYDLTNHAEKVVVPAEQGMVITDIVALQARPLPIIIFDKTSGELNSAWRDDGIGAIHIRSVYDFGDGSFNGCFLNQCTDAANITTVNELGDPANATADQRPARFVRFEKPVALPDEDDPDLGNVAPDLARAAFGPQRDQDMREIIGYAPVEPDGSVKVKLPANIPLAVSVLDKAGRRIGPRHQNWFWVRAGDTMECTGCHTHNTQDNATPEIHHRRDAETTGINAGIDASGTFANTELPGTGLAYSGSLGETMAEVRFREAPNAIPSLPEPNITADVFYSDYWTDPNVRAPDTPFSYEYDNMTVGAISPASDACSPWNFKCRILINYTQHIHTLWALPRINGAEDNTCTNCHTEVDPALNIPKVPDGQLDLTDGFSDQNNGQRFKSYRELFFSDAGQELDANGQLVNIQRTIQVPILDANGNPVLDANGNPTFDTVTEDDPAAATVPTMSGNGARASYFIEKLTETELDAGRSLSTPVSDPNYVDHSGFMTADELRMIGEWLDIGAQYFNDPFDPNVPMN